ncbi:sensor histidine kinase [Lentzea albida]|uniref:sensor histidine kinase n=1 Tax=Lentzea albida TaxID=65499 RepID=UPI001C431C7A|nr:histidine kinase [Lentzea albida]
MRTDPARWWGHAWRLVVAALLGVPFWFATAVLVPPGCAADTCSWLVTGDPLVALACLVLLLWRQRFPLAVALVVTVASSASTLAAGAALLALCSLSTRRRPVEIGVVVLAFMTASQVLGRIYPIDVAPVSMWLELTFPLLCAGTAVAIGVAVGAGRAEARSLLERAESAEREQHARAAQARAQERNRIAREMHDVLAHRISLVAMQAGVLDHRADLTAEDTRLLVRGIADGSQLALQELRDVLGVLHGDPERPEPPQPSLDRLPGLIADSRASGLEVTLVNDVTGEPPELIGRTGYRVVQEGLTNAAKHSPGAEVRVTLEGTAGDELRVSVRNSPATETGPRPPSSGFGLPGLTERVTLAGGTLDHHPAPGGGYLLAARLPWPHRTGRG